jgi:hypothetical protein
LQIQSFINIPKNSKADFIFGLVAANILTLGCLFGYLEMGDIDTDGGIFAAVAMKDLSGGALYQTAWENKPPGVIYLLEILFAVIPNKIFAMYALAIIGLVTLVSGFYNLAYSVSKSMVISILLIALFSFFAVNDRTIGYAMYTEIFGAVFIVWSLNYLIKFELTKKSKDLYLASFLLGFTFWFKEPFIIITIPIFIYIFFKNESLKIKAYCLLFSAFPTLLFVITLLLNDSLIAFLEMIRYNFDFTESIEGSVTKKAQLEHLWHHIIAPLNFIFLSILFNIIRGINSKLDRSNVLLNLGLLISAVLFVLISPHIFNHYYIPFIALFFVSFVLLFKQGQTVYPNSNLIIGIILISTLYKMNDKEALNFKLSINRYEPDKLSQILLKDKNATLFIDLVDASGYYVKGDKLFPTFLPVPVAAHFGDSKNGLINRNRIYKELSANKPKYLITEQSSSYMYWHLPDKDLYYGNYEKLDSVQAKYGKNVILWKLKQH